MWRWWLAILVVFGTGRASGYAVGPGIALEELAKKADVVFKGTVIADRAIVNASFAKLMGYEVRETELGVVSTLKGKVGKTVKFHHYMYAPAAGVGMYSPLAYDMKVGRAYVVFAVAGKGGVVHQFQKEHTQAERQGVVLAADDKPHRGATATEVVWAELRGLATSSNADDAVEGIKRLDEMSGGSRTGQAVLKDFDRQLTLAELRPLIASKNETIATAAIGVFGADSPYFIDEDAPYWLAGIGKGAIPGLGERKPPAVPSAAVAVKELTDVANNNPKLRPLAIRALGRSKIAAGTLTVWARDPDPQVRRAAVLVSAELKDRTLMFAAVADPIADVRRSAALAIGFSQEPKLLPYVDKLLKDPDGKVRAAAAMSILSFAVDQSTTVLTANLKGDFRSLFVNALARRDPKPHLALLGEVIEKDLKPADWWGGRIPAGDSWEIVFEYAKKLPAAELAAGKLDRSLDSLEKMRWYSSSQPRDLYALYVRRGMTARAKQFRAALKKSVSYSMDQYLDEVDKNPATYVP